jgi:hypothetical protein
MNRTDIDQKIYDLYDECRCLGKCFFLAGEFTMDISPPCTT